MSDSNTHLSSSNNHLPGSNKSTVVVVGSSNWDICMYLSTLPAPGETIGDGRLETNLGGKGANQAVACLQAGAETTFISCLGDDDSGQQIKQTYQQLGLPVNSISVLKHCATGTACIFIDDNGENCIGLTPGANARLSRELVMDHKDIIINASTLLLQLETPLDSVSAAAEIAADNNVLVILNPAPATSLPDSLYSLVDVMTPNRGELASLTSRRTETMPELIEAARELIAKGVGKVIVTLGSQGALLVDTHTDQLYPPYPATSKDSTAAGDCFNGYLAAGIAAAGQEKIDLAIRKAMAAAAISVSREGAIPSIPESDEVETFMRSVSDSLSHSPEKFTS